MDENRQTRARELYDHLEDLAHEGDRDRISAQPQSNSVTYKLPSGALATIILRPANGRWEFTGKSPTTNWVGHLDLEDGYGLSMPYPMSLDVNELEGLVADDSGLHFKAKGPRKAATLIRKFTEEFLPYARREDG